MKFSKKMIDGLPASKHIEVPEGGWKPNTMYLVAVAWCKSNPIHYAYLQTGFINDDGSFGSYCDVWCNNYDSSESANKAYFLFPVKKLHTLKEEDA